MILGLAGTNASGKGTLCSILKEHYGFAIVSLADPLREEAAARKWESSTKNLISLGNEFRERDGPGALAILIRKRLPSGDVVIDSIRNPAEVTELRKLPSFVLVSLDAPLKVRYERERSRGRVGNVKSYEEWLAIEKMEDEQNPLHLQVHACMAMADYALVNDGSGEELKQKVAAVLKGIK
ncbi:AAA family ATPase [Candidatus Woesearchaeota archaeon]|nr:AAA family ATPase [Candidatus Woesearchaeota archaeon]